MGKGVQLSGGTERILCTTQKFKGGFSKDPMHNSKIKRLLSLILLTSNFRPNPLEFLGHA